MIPANSDIRSMMVKEFHDSTLGEHAGIKRTLARIATQFTWKGMQNDVKRYVKNCQICQQAKYSTQPTAGLMQPLPIPENIWQDIAMDFVIALPPSHGCTVIMVVMDRLSKFAYFIPLPSAFTAKMAAEAFVQHVVKIHGIPQSIVSDRDKVFTSLFWQQLFQQQGTTLKMSSSYHPQTDGQTEVLNRCLEMYLRCYTQQNPKDWYKLLPWAAYWYNTAFHLAIGMTPFKAVFRRDPPQIPRYEPAATDNPAV